MLACFLVVLTAAGEAQQDSLRLDPGQRVRIHEGKRAVVGTLLSVDSSAMRVLTSHADTAVLRRADVTGVDVSVGTKSRTVSGALIGAGVGTVGVGLIAYILAGTPGLTSGDESLVYVGAAALGGLVLGAGVGAVIGAGSRADKWKPAVWPTFAVRLSGPAGRRVSAGMRITF
jgi:hypothetical protein